MAQIYHSNTLSYPCVRLFSDIPSQMIPEVGFLINSKTEFNTLETIFNGIICGDDFNITCVNNCIKRCLYQNQTLVYKIYNKYINEYEFNTIKIIENIIGKNKDVKQCFSEVVNLILKYADNISIIHTALTNCKHTYHNGEIFNCHDYMNMIKLISLLEHDVYQMSLFKLLDNSIDADIYKIGSMTKIIKYLKYYPSIKKHDACVLDRNPIFCGEFFTNTKHLLLSNLHKIPTEISLPFLEILTQDDMFINMYQSYFVKRIEKQRSSDCLQNEWDCINFLGKLYDDKLKIPQHIRVKQIECNSRKIITKIQKQINDIIDSTTLTDILHNNVHIIIEKDEFKDIPIEQDACNLTILDKYVWDICNVPQVKIPAEIKVYENIIGKLYEIYDAESELIIDAKQSTGVVNIVINDNPYNFLVTLRQMVVILQILKNEEIDYKKLQELTGLQSSELTSIIDSLYSFELINHDENNGMYTINDQFFFIETNVSLLGIDNCNEKFDEIIISNISDILSNGKKTLHDIFEEYDDKYGFVNYCVLEKAIRYLVKKEIFINSNESFGINDKVIDDIDMMLLI